MIPAPNVLGLGSLDWPELVARLAAEARSAPGRAACQALADLSALATDIERARVLGAEVEEVARLLGRGVGLPSLDFEDAEPQLEAAERGEILGLEELRPIALLCEVAAEARAFFRPPPGAGGEESEGD